MAKWDTILNKNRVQQGKFNKTLMNEIALSIDLGTNFIQASILRSTQVWVVAEPLSSNFFIIILFTCRGVA